MTWSRGCQCPSGDNVAYAGGPDGGPYCTTCSRPFLPDPRPAAPPAPTLGKGVEGGVCNRGVCSNTGARYWNTSTRKWYCDECARRINDGLSAPLCVTRVSLPDGAPPAPTPPASAGEDGWRAIAESNAHANEQACQMLFATRRTLAAVALAAVCGYCGRPCADSVPGCDRCPPRIDDFTREELDRLLSALAPAAPTPEVEG